MELINGSWQQTIATLIYDFIQKYDQSISTTTQTISKVITDESETIQNLTNQLIQQSNNQIGNQINQNQSELIRRLQEIGNSGKFDPVILDKLLNEIRSIKGLPEKEYIFITRYINTETTKFIYVPRREDVREPIKTTQNLSYDPTDGWRPINSNSNWLIKSDRFGRTYYRYGMKGRIMRPDEYIRWTTPRKKY